jgi:chromosome partitioning protein
MADTLITPVNNSFADIALLGQFDAISMKLKRLGRFARLVNGLAQARADRHLPAADWIVLPNRLRRLGSANETTINKALAKLAKRAGFRLGHGLGDRVAYRELFLFGLTHLDLKRIPNLGRVKVSARLEIEQLLDDLRLPEDDDQQPDMFIAPLVRHLHIEDQPLVAAG